MRECGEPELIKDVCYDHCLLCKVCRVAPAHPEVGVCDICQNKPKEKVVQPHKHVQLKDLSLEQLQEERKSFQAKIDGPENDGRLTAGSSAALDFWSDMVEEIDAEIKERTGAAAGGIE
jgi:hypothetical protein